MSGFVKLVKPAHNQATNPNDTLNTSKNDSQQLI